MSTITAATILNKAATIIQDTTNVRWPLTELLGWLNDGQREVVLMKPEANAVNASVALTPSTTKQALPANGYTFLRLTRNMGPDGVTPGLAIRIADREVFDAQVPTWHTDPNTANSIKHFVFDPINPRAYYVYPQAPSTPLFVELIYSAAPTDATMVLNGDVIISSTTIGIDDVYANALVDYVLYRAYSKDAEYAGNVQLAMGHFQAFSNSISGKTGADAARNPNQLEGGANPNVPRH